MVPIMVFQNKFHSDLRWLVKLAVLVLMSLWWVSDAPAEAGEYTWTGSGGNNNWQNNGNWSGSSGHPDGSGDYVFFPLVSHSDVDLSGASREVAGIAFLLGTGGIYTIESTSSGGELHNDGDLSSTNDIRNSPDAQQITFDSSMTYYQDHNSNWGLNADPQYMVFNGNLAGSGNITLHGGLTLNHTNTYSGTMTINSDGLLVLGDISAMHSAAVVLNADNGLDITTNSVNANIGALSGSGNLDIGSQTLTLGAKNTDTSYGGILTGDNGSSLLKKQGTGTLTLTGGTGAASSDIDVLEIDAGGIMLSSGAHLQLEGSSFIAGGSLTVSGAGTSLTTNRFEVAHDSGDSGSLTVEDGASLNVISSPLNIGLRAAGTLTVQSGAQVFADTLRLSYQTSDTSTATITGVDTSVTVDHLQIGTLAPYIYGSGSGIVTVENGATFTSNNDTTFNTAVSILIVNGGTFSTDTLVKSPSGVPVIRISDPTGGIALTLGTNDGDSTWAGLIQDDTADGGGPGSIRKTGTGTLTLSNANTYSGGTTLDGGTLSLQNSAAAGTGTITIAVDPTLDYANGINVANPINLTADVTLNVTTGNAEQSGVISESGGSFGITKTGAGSLTLSAANSFSGTADINEGKVILDDVNALQNATVSINVNGGLDVTANAVDANLGALAGNGNLDLGSQTVTVGSNGASTAYSGVITGNIGSKLSQIGSGTLTLTGVGSNFDTLSFVNSSGLIDGAGIALNATTGTSLEVKTSDVVISGGASIVLPEIPQELGITGRSLDWNGSSLTLTGAGTIVTGSRLDVGPFNSTDNQLVVKDSAMLNLTSGMARRLVVATSSSGGLQNVAIESGGDLQAGSIILADGVQSAADMLVTGSGSTVTADNLQLGRGSASLTLEDHAYVDINSLTTFLSSASSLTINGGTFETDTLVNGSASTPVISISDPAGGTALTIGANNGSSTWDGLIQDAAGGPGSILKTGTGTLTLAGGMTGLGTLYNSGGGEVAITADSDLQQINANSGMVDISGAIVELNSDVTNTFYLHNGAGALIENGAQVTLTSTNPNTRLVQTNGGMLTVTGNGSTLAAPRISVGPSGAGSPQFIAELGAAVNVGLFEIGDLGSDDGASGSVAVSSDAIVTADQINLFLRGSLAVNGGQVIANRLANFGSAEVISISDGSLGSALVLGGNGGNSTIDNVIEDNSDGPGSIQKMGAGTLTLTNANTYTGNTIIEGGTLSIEHAYLSDGADVIMDSSATFDLNFTGTDPIHSLFIDNLSRAAGTYGAVGSGADFQMSLFTGNGLLQVSSFVGLAGDYNNDGSVNAADYVVWRKNEGAPAGTLVNDPNSGVIGQAQYDTWRANFGVTAGSGAGAIANVAVPEPASIALLIMGTLVLCSDEMRRCHKLIHA